MQQVANVTIENPNDEEGDDVMEMKNMAATSKTWNESEKTEKVNRRQSLLERMRSSKSKSNESTSEEEEEPDEEDDIKPLPEDAKRKRKKAAEVMKRPSFQKQTSRYNLYYRTRVNKDQFYISQGILYFMLPYSRQ